MQQFQQISPDTNNFLQIAQHCLEKPLKSLWYIGNLPAKRRAAVAIVGTRKPTPYGREIAYRLSYELASKGVVIISGLALGTDGIAHQAALDAGGTTIAVLPTSLESIYPYTHRSLARRIAENGGALVTEYSPGTQAYKSNFIARNRIVSALSDGLVIIEAAERSGTLSTANFALEQGKAVMAVPGNITSPMSVGCNNLIKTGARLVATSRDVLEEIGLSDDEPLQLPLAHTPEQQQLISLLAEGVRDGDELLAQSNLTPALFNQTLTMLEIEGKIRALGANQWTIH